MEKNFINYFIENCWNIQGTNKSAQKSFVFKDFKSAFSWMTLIAILAEKFDHHPEWKNVYKTVEVKLITHDTGNLSTKDLNLAKAMDNEFKKYS